MMKILFLNYPYLQKKISKDHQTYSLGPYLECDLVIAQEEVEKKFNYSFVQKNINLQDFDCVIYGSGLDQNFLFEGIEKFEIPTIYLVVDSTINFFWQKYYAPLFDLVLIDQPTDLALFKGCNPNTDLLLLGFDEDYFKDYGLEKKYDLTFVGRTNPHRIKRNNLLEFLAAEGFKLNLIDGINKRLDSAELAKTYNQSKIVINENLFPSINLRLFEAIASNTLLFTEDTNPCLDFFFKNEQDLILFNRNNLSELLRKYLKNDQKREALSRQAYLKAQNFHSDQIRAGELVKKIEKVKKLDKKLVRENFFLAKYLVSLKWNYEFNFDFGGEENFSATKTQILFYYFKAKFLKNYHNSPLNNISLSASLDISTKIILFWHYYFSKKIEQCYQILSLNPFKEFIERKIKKNISEIINDQDILKYLLGACLFETKVNLIDFGFTDLNKDIALFTAIDYLTAIRESCLFYEDALKMMGALLAGAKAYDFAALIYEKLSHQSASSLYSSLRDIYKYKSYDRRIR